MENSIIIAVRYRIVLGVVRYRIVLGVVKLIFQTWQWEQFLELGADMETSQVEDRMKSQTPNQCASLVYTVRHNLQLLNGQIFFVQKLFLF